ncbi:programmed cell death protein 11 [Mus musculus]|nr:programmed cell death protein 11 [Mus musculus]
MANLEESFPRGGTRKLHKSEKSSQQVVEQDNLFDVSTEEGPIKRKKSQKGPAKTKKLKIEKRKSIKSIKEKFEILSLESLCEGMRILGCVKEVSELELVVSLPNGLQGFVQVTEVCDAYTQKLNEQVAQEEPLEDLLRLPELFSPGMLVRCVVSSLDVTESGKKSVKLSVNPKRVNKVLSADALRPGMLLTGTVSSLEDHGYLVDIGVGGTRAFLSLKKAQEYIRQKNKGAKFKVGQYLTCVVEEVKSNGGVVSLSVEHSEVSSAFATEEQSWNLNNLLPGLLVKAQVQKVTQFGLQLNFLTFFKGLVDFMHLEPKKMGSYSSNQTVKACILCVHPRTRVVRLSLRPIFLHPGRPLTRISYQQLGAVLDDVPVQGFFKNAGAIFRLKDGVLAYARVSHLSDSKKAFNAEAFKPGSTHKCRIIDYSQMDELALLSLRKSIIAAPFLRYHDIKIGTVVKGTVLAIKPFGILVKVGEQIKGLVPSMHLADIMMKNPEKKYSPGDEVKCRVLLCDPEAKKLIMTLKKTLVTSKLSLITCYEGAKPGLQTHGVIIRVKDYGCIVKFYNDVQGLVPKHELSTQHIPDPETVFYTGQVVKVAVLSCEPSKERMLLSFRLLSDSRPKDPGVESSQKKTGAVRIGQLVDVKVLEKTKTGLEVAILPHNTPAFLPTPHLSDHAANGPLLHHWLQTVEGGQDPKSLSEIQPGMLLIGFVKCIKEYGVFVQFPSGLSGLSPKTIMSDKFVTTPSEHFVEGQTVVAKVTNVDESKQRMLLSLRLSDCSLGDSASTSFLLLCQCLEELQGIRSLMSNQDSVLIQTLADMTPGMVLDAVVHEVLEDGSVVFSSDPVPDLVLRASRYHRAGQEVEPGQKKKVVVLHVDMLKLEVHVSLHQDLVNRKTRKLRKSSRHQGIVQHLEESFAVASLVETGHLVAFSLISHLNDTFHFDSEKLRVGQGVCLTLKTTEPGVTADGFVGCIHASRILDDVPVGTSPTTTLKAGKKVTARVIGGRDVKTYKFLPISHPRFVLTILELSVRPSELKGSYSALNTHSESPVEKIRQYQAGQTVTCFFKKYNVMKKWLEVDIGPDIRGRIPLLLTSLSFKVLKHPDKKFQVGQAIEATVVDPDVPRAFLCLSLIGPYRLEEGEVAMGRVMKVVPNRGLTVSFPFGKIGKVSMFHLSDSYSEAPLEDFCPQKIVRCYILSTAHRVLALSLRSSRTNRETKNRIEDPEINSIEDVKEGQLLRGYVKCVLPSSVIIGLGPSVLGLAKYSHVSECVPPEKELYNGCLPEGKLVTAKELVNKRPKKSGAAEEDDSGVEVYYREGEDEVGEPKLPPRGKQTKSTEVPRLHLSSGFLWDVGLDSLTPALPLREESSDSEDEQPHQAKPESADDFDRLVLSSPNSSILWLQYMAFHLQATEIEKARAVAERALKTISFREEQEKLNVWVALLNLENMYGSQESLTKVFERAVQYNEPLKVFLHLADIYTKSEKYKEAGELYNRMLKRFRQEKAVWIKYGAFVLGRSQAGASHRVLQRALECLPAKEHVDVIVKFAQLEFQLGDVERAKAIFENTLSTYPKRTDVWSVYIDMTIKHGSQTAVRDIFERVIHLSLAPKRMKFFFKRYLDYEKQHGTEKDVQAVKAKALEYVEAKSSALED